MAAKIKFLLSVLCLCLLSSGAMAIPTETIWVPNDKAEKEREFRFDSDVLFTLDKRSGDPGAPAPFIDEGVTYGFFNNYTVAGEGGFDWWEPQSQDNLKSLHIHFKFSVIETDKFPGVALGFYNFGFKANTTDQDILYLGLAKTWAPGHFWLGFFSGNQNVLVDERGNPSNSGVMLSWERPFPTIGKNFSMLADFQSSTSVVGALNLGVKWKLGENILSLGYDIYNNHNLTPRDTVNIKALMRL